MPGDDPITSGPKRTPTARDIREMQDLCDAVAAFVHSQNND